MEIINKWSQPVVLTSIEDVSLSLDSLTKVLPTWEEIPEDFRNKQGEGKKWVKVLEDWFFNGIELSNVVMKDGIEKRSAIRHIGHIMHSWKPKHEHKIAGCAYLMSLWFERFDYTKRGKSEISK